MISDTDTTRIISDKGDGTVAGLSSGGLSIICHIISILMQSFGFRKRWKWTRKLFCMASYSVLQICVRNLRGECLLSAFLFKFSKSVSLFDCVKNLHFFLPGRDHWVFFFLFTYFNLHLFAQPYPETNSHLHLYRKMHCMERIFYFLQIFSNIILVGPPKTGLIIHYSDCCFVFLFVIGMGRDSGWRMWEAQLGGTDTIIYS